MLGVGEINKKKHWDSVLLQQSSKLCDVSTEEYQGREGTEKRIISYLNFLKTNYSTYVTDKTKNYFWLRILNLELSVEAQVVLVP